MSATTGKTRCETVDLTVRWDEVIEGDLVLYNGRQEVVTDIVLNPASMCLRLDGAPEPVWVRRDEMTTVFRYVEH